MDDIVMELKVSVTLNLTTEQIREFNLFRSRLRNFTVVEEDGSKTLVMGSTYQGQITIPNALLTMIDMLPEVDH